MRAYVCIVWRWVCSFVFPYPIGPYCNSFNLKVDLARRLRRDFFRLKTRDAQTVVGLR